MYIILSDFYEKSFFMQKSKYYFGWWCALWGCSIYDDTMMFRDTKQWRKD